MGEVEYPAHHGVGRRDAMIDDEDRRALPIAGTIRAASAPETSPQPSGAASTTCWRGMSSVRVRAWSASRWIASGGRRRRRVALRLGRRTDDTGRPHYFRIQGPATLIEFDNAEDNANHVHSVWREPSNDFGADLLMRHHLEHGAVDINDADHASLRAG